MKDHKERMLKMRQSLKSSPLITKTTMALEVKIEKIKLRRKSVSLDMPMLDKNLANSESEGEEEDTSDFDERYTMGEKIGEGAHGVVKKCYCKLSGDLLAVKTMVLDQ